MRVSPANSWISHDIVGPNCHIFVIIDDVCWWNDGRGGKVLSTKVLHLEQRQVLQVCWFSFLVLSSSGNFRT